MEIPQLKVRQAFRAWFTANHEDVMETDELAFYRKPEIEQMAYYLSFLEDKGVVVMLGVNDQMFNKYFAKLYYKVGGKTDTLPKNVKTPGEAYRYGVEKAFEILSLL